MRTLCGFAIALLAATCLIAQNRGGLVNPGGVARTNGSVLYPGGTSAIPGVQRTTGSVLYPGSGAGIGVPSAISGGVGVRGGQFFGPGAGLHSGARHGGGGVIVYPFAYPVYVGGYGAGYGGYDPYAAGMVQPPQQQQPNVTVIMPPQPPPVIINQFGTPPAGMLSQPQAPPESAPVETAQAGSPEPTGYLIAFKDHTIYSAVAYWLEGDTLHYFTSGNTHNQVSLALIDRDLTVRLNRESGIEVKLPPAK